MKDDRDEEGPSHLLQGLGEQVVALWRASLLCKRILLLSEPPIGRLCWWVHWVSLLGAHSTPGLPSALLRPLYYVSLADLDLLAEQHAYVACEWVVLMLYAVCCMLCRTYSVSLVVICSVFLCVSLLSSLFIYFIYFLIYFFIFFIIISLLSSLFYFSLFSAFLVILFLCLPLYFTSSCIGNESVQCFGK